MKIKEITLIGLFIALALIISYFEKLIPPVIPLPGIKLGISNIVLVLCLYMYSLKTTYFVGIIKVLLVNILFGSITSLFFGLLGTILSIQFMYFFKYFNKNTIVGVSIVGAVFHNLGQIIAASIIFENISLMYYLPILIISGIMSGFMVGIISSIVYERLSHMTTFIR